MSEHLHPASPKSGKATAISMSKPSLRPMAGKGGIYLDLNFVPSSDEALALVDTLRNGKRLRTESKGALGALAADMVRVVAAGIEEYGFRELGNSTFSDAPVGFKAFNSALKVMEDSGFIEVCKALKMMPLPGDKPAKATTFHPTSAFLSALDKVGIIPAEWERHFEQAPRPAFLRQPIVLRAGSGRAEKKPWEKVRGQPMKVDMTDPKVVALAEQVNTINAYMVDKSIEPAGCHRAFCRIYGQGNLKGVRYDRGGRLYSIGNSYQVWDKDEKPRSNMRINGEPIVEVDISASHLTIAHALLEEPLPGGDDPYEGLEMGGRPIPRSVAKAWVTNTLGLGNWLTRWSSESIKKALKADDPIDLKKYPVRKLNKIMCDRFPAMERWKASYIRWGQLQYRESCAIVDAVYTLMTEHDLVALPLHDAVIVPTDMGALAKDILSSAFLRHVGVVPRIKLKVPEK